MTKPSGTASGDYDNIGLHLSALDENPGDLVSTRRQRVYVPRL